MAEFKVPAPDEFDVITHRTAQQLKRHLFAADSHDDRCGARVIITLTNGAVAGFPRSALPGLESATPDDLRKIEIEGGGSGVRVARRAVIA